MNCSRSGTRRTAVEIRVHCAPAMETTATSCHRQHNLHCNSHSTKVIYKITVARTRTQTRTRAHTHRQAHTRTDTHTCTHTLTDTHTHTHARTHARTHTHTHAQTRTHRWTDTTNLSTSPIQAAPPEVIERHHRWFTKSTVIINISKQQIRIYIQMTLGIKKNGSYDFQGMFI